jgi:uncharacterized membrane protein YbhN (UPF0104 family)
VANFLHAVHIFFDDLASVRWGFLVLALALHFVRLMFRGVAWRAILMASYPGERIRFLTVFGAYVAGVGINSIAPARAGDVVKLYLVKQRMPYASYATLTPTLFTETLLDFFVAGALMIWALSIGVLPTHDVYSRLPSVDWGFFVRHEHATAVGVLVALAVATVAFIVFLERGSQTRERLLQGFAILRTPSRYFRGVVVPQLVSWVFRLASTYYFLKAFGVNATIHNALLSQVVDSLATLFPATPGGAGTKQGLIVFVFNGEAVSKSLLLAFSVGMNIALVVFNVVIGGIALYLMARTISWKRLRAAQAEEQAT